jgi:hypothetical protein
VSFYLYYINWQYTTGLLLVIANLFPTRCFPLQREWGRLRWLPPQTPFFPMLYYDKPGAFPKEVFGQGHKVYGVQKPDP